VKLPVTLVWPKAGAGAVPNVVPPLAQLVGGDDCGPNTVTVIVPIALLVAPSSDTVAPKIAEPTVIPDSGGLTPTVGTTRATTVSGIEGPHVELAALLLASPP
jgi:hypothetical protein